MPLARRTISGERTLGKHNGWHATAPPAPLDGNPWADTSHAFDVGDSNEGTVNKHYYWYVNYQ